MSTGGSLLDAGSQLEMCAKIKDPGRRGSESGACVRAGPVPRLARSMLTLDFAIDAAHPLPLRPVDAKKDAQVWADQNDVSPAPNVNTARTPSQLSLSVSPASASRNAPIPGMFRLHFGRPDHVA